MTVQQLIELSILDAMGLLDEDERVSFESAFRAAAPGIQAHVRREQTRLSRIESLLPEVEPPAGLRALVLEAVRAHMATEVGEDDGLARLVLPMTPSRGVSPFWRAGALGLAAASLMLGITTYMFQAETTKTLQRIQNDSLIEAMMAKYGHKFMKDAIFDSDTERVVFKPAAEGFKGEAAIFLNPEWGSAKFFCRAMASAEGHNYKLAIIDSEGKVVQVIDEFTSSGEIMQKDVKLKQGTTGRLAVLKATIGEQPTILTEAMLLAKSL
jgi:anti-sigma-K factor RskA